MKGIFMNGIRFTQGRSLWRPLAMAGWLVFAGNAPAAADTPGTAGTPGVPSLDKMTRDSPPDIVKPVVPGKAELADSAFKKLDPTNKGYVDKDDTRGLVGFDPIFDKVDTKHTGKLNFSQFKAAWRQYAQDKPPSAGKAAGN